MALKTQSLLLATASYKKMLYTLPCEHFYPIVIHRTIDETREKESGLRCRYSSKVAVTHLLSGGQLALCLCYEHARIIAEELKDEVIFLMPTVDLLTTHPDWDRVAEKVTELKSKYAIA